MSKLKIGIIGVGSFAQSIHLPLLQKSKEVEITAICDIDKIRLQNVAKKFNIEKTYHNVENFINENKFDATFVLTQTDAHKELSFYFNENCGYIFIEKPIARTLKDSFQFFENIKKKNIPLFVGMNMRFRPDALMLKSLLEGNFLGNTSLIRLGYFKPFSSIPKKFNQNISYENIVLDLGISIIDLALWLLNYPEAYSITSKIFSLKSNQFYDTASAFIKTIDGKVISLDITWSLENEKEIFYCNLFSEKGYAFLNPLRLSLNDKNINSEIVTVPNLKVKNQFLKSYENEINYFIEILKGLKVKNNSYLETVQRMKLVEAFIKSAKLNKEVIINKSR